MLIGGPHDDELNGGPGDDVLEGGAGADRLDGDASGDAAAPSPATGGNDLLRGGPGADHLQGGPGDDQLDGGSGNDILEGGRDSDTIAGGAGLDHLVYNRQSAGRTTQAPELRVTFNGLPDDGPARERDNVFGDVERAYSLTGAVLSPFPGSGAPVVQPLSDRFGRPLDTRVGARIYRLSAHGTEGAQTGLFRGAPFRVLDTGRNDQATELRLTGGDFSACRSAASVARRHSTARRLWGNAKGKFRTVGRYASATVRGTKWLTEETCAGTLIRVARGVVSVLDIPHHRTLLLRAPHSFLSHPSRGG